MRLSHPLGEKPVLRSRRPAGTRPRREGWGPVSHPEERCHPTVIKSAESPGSQASREALRAQRLTPQPPASGVPGGTVGSCGRGVSIHPPATRANDFALAFPMGCPEDSLLRCSEQAPECGLSSPVLRIGSRVWAALRGEDTRPVSVRGRAMG